MKSLLRPQIIMQMHLPFSMDFKNILFAYEQRINELKKDGRFRYISIFKNYGEVAGASMEHPHSQVIALPVAPKRALEEMNGAEAYYLKIKMYFL